MNKQAREIQQEVEAGRKVVWIDVRTPVEHEEERIAGSLLMPLDRLDVGEVKRRSEGADLTVLVCRSGKRAEQALQRLTSAGCQNLVVLAGGVNGWLQAGLPAERTHRTVLPLMRQVQLIIGLLSLTSSVLALTVDRNFAFIPAFLGAGLTMAGVTGWCGLAILLSKMPWNRVDAACQGVKSCSLK